MEREVIRMLEKSQKITKKLIGNLREIERERTRERGRKGNKRGNDNSENKNKIC